MENKPVEIVILSGKGGTGKTSFTASFASIAKNAVFADCDVDAADLHLVLSPDIYKEELFPSGDKAEIIQENCSLCGLCQQLCRFQAINYTNNHFNIDEYSCEGCGLCVTACPEQAIQILRNNNNKVIHARSRFGPLIYGNMAIAEENSGKLVSKIREYAREKARETNARYIIIDGPPGIGCPAISSVTGADIVLAVTEPTLSGWHDLQRLIKMVKRFQNQLVVILNKYDLNEQMASNIENELNLLHIPLIGKIPFTENVIFALLEGKSIIEYAPEDPVSIQIISIWNDLKNTINEAKYI
ncbi:MAG: 4Fe-4S binding protein [Bacteroidales bacterium]|nr:4Fe-4S binding protein [Bacteroidales bacterium]